MQDGHATPAAGRHIPFKQEGWGVALFVVFLAVASAATATYIHKKTYLPPTNVKFHGGGDLR
jgi:hypothetical protein